MSYRQPLLGLERWAEVPAGRKIKRSGTWAAEAASHLCRLRLAKGYLKFQVAFLAVTDLTMAVDTVIVARAESHAVFSTRVQIAALPLPMSGFAGLYGFGRGS